MDTTEVKDLNELDTVLLLKETFSDLELHTINTHRIDFSVQHATAQEKLKNEGIISAMALSCGWFLSTRPSWRGYYRYGIERINVSEAKKARYLFHAARREVRASIEANGLQLARYATTFTGRTYPCERVHFAKSVHGVLGFIRSKLTHDPANAGRTISGNELLASIADIDVWSISNASTKLVYIDPYMENGGVWSTEAVPPTDLRLVPDLDQKAKEIIDLVERGIIAW